MKNVKQCFIILFIVTPFLIVEANNETLAPFVFDQYEIDLNR